jgi:hypothetical protein
MIRHIYQFNTHAEKGFFLGPELHGLYDMIALNGNIISHTPASIAAFVSTTGKDFYIDPQTHAFQHATIYLKRDISDKEKGEPPKYDFKPSVVRLAKERLGGIFASVIDRDTPISLKAFLTDDNVNDSVIESVCQSVGDFQLNTMVKELDEEAKDFIGDMSKITPQFLVAPYFYLSTTKWLDWLKINSACYRKMKVLFGSKPIYFSLVMSKDILRNHREEIVREISSLHPDGILLWIDDHQEELLEAGEVQWYVSLLKQLRAVTSDLLSPHGGYLSTLLCHSEAGHILDGVGHAMNYGEHRSVIPIGGGLPMAHFYFRSVHARLRFADAAAVFVGKNWLNTVEDYKQNICKCRQCQELINLKNSAEASFFAYGESSPNTFTRRTGTIVRLSYPTTDAKLIATKHYLYNKALEFSDVMSRGFGELVAELKRIYDALTDDIGAECCSHLIKWHSVLKDFPEF